jgi:hypothetical protein
MTDCTRIGTCAHCGQSLLFAPEGLVHTQVDHRLPGGHLVDRPSGLIRFGALRFPNDWWY